MSKGVIVPLSYQARNIDALVYNVKNDSADIDNGILLTKGALSTNAKEGEVFNVTLPVANATGLLMAYSAENVITTDASGNQYKVGDLNPKDFTNVKGIVFNAISLKEGDRILMSVDCFASAPATSNTVATVNTSGKLVPANSLAEGATGTYFNILKKSYISIADGFASQRTEAYEVEVAKN